MRRVAGKRSPQNRRLTRGGSEHLLDVRVRRSTAKRQRRHRALRVILGVTLWAGIAAGACYGFNAIVHKFFLENPEYNLRVVDAELDGLMSREEVMQITGIQTGRNIFRIDLGAAERALQQIDQIDKVTLERDWPDRITIRITKRVPVAWLARASSDDKDHTLLLDAQGHTMKPYRVEPEYWRLPVVFVPEPGLIEKRDTLAVADLQAALDLLAARAARPDSLLDIRSIDVSKGFALEIVDLDNAHYTFAPREPAAQLERLQKLLAHSRDTGRRIESVNLIPKKYTPVRFLLASATEAAPAEPAPKKSR